MYMSDIKFYICYWICTNHPRHTNIEITPATQTGQQEFTGHLNDHPWLKDHLHTQFHTQTHTKKASLRNAKRSTVHCTGPINCIRT